MGLFIPRLTLRHLREEPLLLVNGVVQFREGVRQFPACDEELEALDEIRIVFAALREGRYVRGIIGDKGRLDELRLHHSLEYLVQELPEGLAALQVCAELFGVVPGLARVREDIRSDPGFTQRVEEADPLPRRRKVYGMSFVFHHRRTEHFLCNSADHLLRHLDKVAIVRIGHVELEHGELGIVPGRDALVPEVAVDLVHALEPADEQALEVQLGRDPEVKVHVKGVVVRLEGPRRGAAGDGLHHRRFHFEEPAGNEK